jgi:aquaporin related protein
MLEYETANPGQDRSREKGEHFNPDLDTSHPRVSFAPEDYAEQGLAGSHTTNGTNGDLRRIGTPKEYGTDRRPFSDSPAPPHPNDQFAGLTAGGMHGDEYIKPTTRGSGSDQTLGGNSVNHTRVAHKSAIKPGSRVNGVVNGHEGSLRNNIYNNMNMGGGIPGDETFYDKP